MKYVDLPADYFISYQQSCTSLPVSPPTCPADILAVAHNDCDVIKLENFDLECPGAEEHYDTCVSAVCNCPEGWSQKKCSCTALLAFFTSKCHSNVNWLPLSVCSDECELRFNRTCIMCTVISARFMYTKQVRIRIG